MNEIVFEICGLKDSFNYCWFYFEEVYFDFGKAMKGKWIISSASGAQNAGRGDRIAEAWRNEERGMSMVFGCHYEHQEAPEVISLGLWRHCTPFLALHLQEFNSINQYHSILPRSKYFQPQKNKMFFFATWEKRNAILLNFENRSRGFVLKNKPRWFFPENIYPWYGLQAC